jgi:hypothetical protein
MRAVLATVALCATTLQFAAAQGPVPRGHLYRGPHYFVRDATVVEPEGGLPLAFSESSLVRSLDVMSDLDLMTTVRSKTVRTIPVSGITLRVAFGPTAHGMITYRVRARELRWNPPPAIAPDSVRRALRFSIVPADPAPGVLALTPEMKIVFTMERIEDNGVVIFDNPDATELLWVALGRPALSEP